MERIAQEAKTSQEWQPIETAPKDGSWILVVSYSEIAIAKWNSEDYFTDGGPCFRCSYWMPLPELPSK